MKTSAVVDLRDPAAVLSALENARQGFEQDGPVIPTGYVFSGYMAQPRERLPVGVGEFVVEFADALAESGPSEVGLSAMDWVVARKLTKSAAASIRHDPPITSYGKAKQAVVVVHGMYERIAQGKSHSERETSLMLDEFATGLAPEDRVLMEWRTTSGNVVIATDRKLLVRRADGGTSTVWSHEYPYISSMKFTCPFPWTANRLTIVAGDDQVTSTASHQTRRAPQPWPKSGRSDGQSTTRTTRASTRHLPLLLSARGCGARRLRELIPRETAGSRSDGSLTA